MNTVPLRRLALCLDGRRVPLSSEQRSEVAGDVPYWGANGVVDHVRDALFDEPLVLVGEDGSPFFDRAKDVAFTVSGPIWPNNHIHVLRPMGVDARFLTYALNAVDYGSVISGSTRDKLTQADMASIRIPEHPIVAQQRIADFLDDRVSRINRIIAARREQMGMVERQYTSWLQEHVDDLGQRHGWTQLRRLGLLIEQGWSPAANSAPAAPCSPGVLKLGAVRGGSFRPCENKGFLEGTEPKPEYLLREGDLLVTRANTPSLVGDAAVVEGLESSPLYLSDLIYRLRIDNMDHTFVSTALRAPRVRQKIGIIARGTSSSMPKLRGTDIAGLPLPTVPASLQREAGLADVRHREERDAKAASLESSIGLLTEYKSSLITAAVKGDLDVSTAGSSIPG